MYYFYLNGAEIKLQPLLENISHIILVFDF